MKFSLYYCLLIAVFLQSCSYKPKYLPYDLQNELSHRLLFGRVSKNLKKRLDTTGIKVYYSPYLVYRDSLFDRNSNFYSTFDYREIQITGSDVYLSDIERDSVKKEKLSTLYDTYPLDTFKLIIPDSLSEMYAYYKDGMDVSKKKSTFWFVSPLLPTKEKYIYFKQVFGYTTLIDKTDFIQQIQTKSVKLYRIKRNNIERIGSIDFDFFSL